MIPAASRLSRPMIVGRKYRKTRNSRVSTVHPFHFDHGAADTPARLSPIIRIPLPKCFPSLSVTLSSCPVFLLTAKFLAQTSLVSICQSSLPMSLPSGGTTNRCLAGSAIGLAVEHLTSLDTVL
jgi:hypothetical protein